MFLVCTLFKISTYVQEFSAKLTFVPIKEELTKKLVFFNASHRQEPQVLPLDATLWIPSCPLGFCDVAWIIIQSQLEFSKLTFSQTLFAFAPSINPRHGPSTRFEQCMTILNLGPNIESPCKRPLVEPIHELSLFSPHSQWKGSDTLHWWVSLMFYSWMLTPFPFQPTLALKLVGPHFAIGSLFERNYSENCQIEHSF